MQNNENTFFKSWASAVGLYLILLIYRILSRATVDSAWKLIVLGVMFLGLGMIYCTVGQRINLVPKLKRVAHRFIECVGKPGMHLRMVLIILASFILLLALLILLRAFTSVNVEHIDWLFIGTAAYTGFFAALIIRAEKVEPQDCTRVS
ncbi:MAG: hypothetical protein FH749_01595 [Firmicutes bacterium]|nr:hypothetical protein [Bacillota bacterium]